jgi:hypothetical protein
MKLKSQNLERAMAFLIATPETGVDSIITSYALLPVWFDFTLGHGLILRIRNRSSGSASISLLFGCPLDLMEHNAADFAQLTHSHPGATSRGE